MMEWMLSPDSSLMIMIPQMMREIVYSVWDVDHPEEGGDSEQILIQHVDHHYHPSVDLKMTDILISKEL